MLPAITFYFFSAILILSALMVITARNPVHSVLFLILGFFTSAGLFVLLGAEFVAMILVIVYVGAVAVLFLFVVMMLDVSFEDIRKGAMQFIPAGLLTGGVLLAEFVLIFKTWRADEVVLANRAMPMTDSAELALSNTESLGMILYTDYVYAFQAAGLILLVAMIGAIVLTHRRRTDTRRQKITEQINRKPEDAMEIEKVTTGVGI